MSRLQQKCQKNEKLLVSQSDEVKQLMGKIKLAEDDKINLSEK